MTEFEDELSALTTEAHILGESNATKTVTANLVRPVVTVVVPITPLIDCNTLSAPALED